MSAALLLIMLGSFLIVSAAVVILVILLLRPNLGKTKTVQKQPVEAPRAAFHESRRWILPIVIALILMKWTIAGAIFFLAVVRVMQLDPKSNSKQIPYPSDAERKKAQGMYAWLFWSPLLTMPTLLMAGLSLSYDASINQRVIVSLIPVIFHLWLLLNLNTNSAFVFRHTQQAILLVALRAGMAALAISIGNVGDGIAWFLIGNGSLWVFGTLWARSQAGDAKCWWSERKGETIAAKPATVATPDLPRLEHFSPKENLEKSRELMERFKKADAKDYAVLAFRHGDHEIRLQAIELLEVLEEVEKF